MSETLIIKHYYADIVIKDTLDKNVEFIEASNNGKLKDGVVTWKLEKVKAGKEGKVTLTVKVLEGALKSKGGEGKVVNGGDSTTVKIDNDDEQSVEEVKNPVEEKEKETEKDKSKGGSSGSGGGSSVTKGGTSPKTGDDTPIAMWITIMMPAVLAAGTIAVVRRRRKEET